jgi:hypothetical protein
MNGNLFYILNLKIKVNGIIFKLYQGCTADHVLHF